MGKINRKKIIIVDGYNVINAWKELKKYVEKDLEQARDLLIEKLVNYRHIKDEEIILVFDAHLVEGNFGSERVVNGIKVVFTEEKKNADSYIEELVARLAKDPRNLIKVVTFDFQEQKNVLGSGAIRVTPREFKYRLIDAEKRIRKKYVEKKTEKISNDLVSNKIDSETLKKLKEISSLKLD